MFFGDGGSAGFPKRASIPAFVTGMKRGISSSPGSQVPAGFLTPFAFMDADLASEGLGTAARVAQGL